MPDKIEHSLATDSHSFIIIIIRDAPAFAAVQLLNQSISLAIIPELASRLIALVIHFFPLSPISWDPTRPFLIFSRSLFVLRELRGHADV